MEKPVVSVIIPTNRFDEKFIRAINSVLNQSFNNTEILILVNGPDANFIGKQIHESFSDFRISVHILNTFLINFSLAYGVEFAKGDFIVRLDSDDYMSSDRIQEQLEFISMNSEYAIVGSFVGLIQKSKLIGIKQYPITDTDIKNSMFYRNPFCHPSIIFRKSIIQSIGSYQGGVLAEDYDLYVRLTNSSKQIKFYNIPKVLTYYNIDDGEAKKSKRAYVSMISTQSSAFLNTYNLKWFLATLISFYKLIFYSNKS